MTLAELARLSGASISTVSKAFSGSAEISEATRERIFSAAKKHGCFDKYYKGPRDRRMIALIFPESESEYYGTQIGLLEKEFSKRGADTVIALTRFDAERGARLFRELVYRMKVDGVIVSGSGRLIDNPDEIPLVTIGSATTRAEHSDNIHVDLKNGVREIIGLIKEYGHKSVGFIGETLTQQKYDFFCSAMRYHGLPLQERYIAVSNKRFAPCGEECMRMLIERGDVPSVIVAAYDQIAYGAMRYAKAHGYDIPNDISFVGMDDISVTDYLDVPLTSLHTHTEDVCARVADLIFKRIDNRHYRERTEIVIPATLNLRKSLAKK